MILKGLIKCWFHGITHLTHQSETFFIKTNILDRDIVYIKCHTCNKLFYENQKLKEAILEWIKYKSSKANQSDMGYKLFINYNVFQEKYYVTGYATTPPSDTKIVKIVSSEGKASFESVNQQQGD